MAPTYLDIAGLDKSKYPAFLDGRSLFEEWKSGGGSVKEGIAKEVLNVEFWGSIDNGAAPDFSDRHFNNSYKTVRYVSEDTGWLFSVRCKGNATELYDTNVS